MHQRPTLLTPARLGAAAITLAAPSAGADRPLSTDDAGTAPADTRQLAGWGERAPGDAHAYVLAPACRVALGWAVVVDARSAWDCAMA